MGYLFYRFIPTEWRSCRERRLCDVTSPVKWLWNCVVLSPGVCSLPMSVGPCRGSFIRWYYDTDTRRCRMFTYGGCRGNGNRFDSADQCRRTCSQHPDDDVTVSLATTTPTARSSPRKRIRNDCSLETFRFFKVYQLLLILVFSVASNFLYRFLYSFITSYFVII